MWQRIKNVYHLGNAILANLWLGFPSRHLTVIGVTGTDGKTTTVSLIYYILREAGYNVSMISSVGAIIRGKAYDVGLHVTTPSPWALQKFTKKAVNSTNDTFEEFDTKLERVRHSGEEERRLQNLSACSMVQGDSGRAHSSLARMTMSKASCLVLEVTSHAIDQNRIWGMPFAVGVLTNVTHEHLDYHKSYENYVNTKTKLLKMARVAVVNRDDNSYALVKSEIRNPKSETNSRFPAKQDLASRDKTQKLITYGMKQDTHVNPQKFPFKSKLIGEFNRYNILAAVAACKALGISDQYIRKGIETFKAPIGREEIVFKKDFTVMIDFAHTPNAFEQILSSVKPNIKGRLIHVFGAAGQRDAIKRPLMGKASSKYSDVIILTAEDPRSESVEKIIGEIKSGIMNYELRIKNRTLLEIYDRKEAINTAIKMARKRDFVLITGKSHEKSMNYGKGEEQWDEFRVVKNALLKRKIRDNKNREKG